MILTLCLLPCDGRAEESLEAEAKQFHSRVQTITRRPKSADRMTAVAELLNELKIPYKTEDFEANDETVSTCQGEKEGRSEWPFFAGRYVHMRKGQRTELMFAKGGKGWKMALLERITLSWNT